MANCSNCPAGKYGDIEGAKTPGMTSTSCWALSKRYED
jgi:hypothetical protein